jgi:hypothetical protein
MSCVCSCLPAAARADYAESEKLIAEQLTGLQRDAAWTKSYMVSALLLTKECMQVRACFFTPFDQEALLAAVCGRWWASKQHAPRLGLLRTCRSRVDSGECAAAIVTVAVSCRRLLCPWATPSSHCLASRAVARCWLHAMGSSTATCPWQQACPRCVGPSGVLRGTVSLTIRLALQMTRPATACAYAQHIQMLCWQ